MHRITRTVKNAYLTIIVGKFRHLLLAAGVFALTVVSSISGALVLAPVASAATIDQTTCIVIGGRWIPTSADNKGVAYCGGPGGCAANGGVWSPASNTCTSYSPAKSDRTVEQLIKSHLYYNAITECYTKSGDGWTGGNYNFRDTIWTPIGTNNGQSTKPTDSARDANWFYGANNDSRTVLGLDEKGCNSITQNGLSTSFGYGTNYYSFLKDIGFSWQRDNPPDNTRGDWRWETSNRNATIDKVGETLRAKGAVTSGGPAEDYYLASKQFFASSCGAQRIGNVPYDQLDASTKSLVNNDSNKIRVMEIVNGELVEYAYSLGGPNTPYQVTDACKEFARTMNSTIPSYLGALITEACYKANPDSTSPLLNACKAGQQNKTPDYCTKLFGSSNPALKAACEQGQGQVISDTASGTTSNISPDESTTTCGVEGVGWIICPAMKFLGTVTGVAFDFLAGNFLETKASIVSDPSTVNAWSVMRNLANVAFVIAFLIIIFSQLTSVGITNYGVKKMLPRLVIAAILVNVSFLVCQIAVDISNILGYSLKNLFNSLQGYMQISNSNITDASGDARGIAVLIAGLVAGTIGLAFAVSIPVLLSAVVALLFIALILFGRTALIILLVIVSPLAFVAYLLPNTEQWFKKWYKMFSSLLLVFPIIAVVFGASSLAANIISNAAASYGSADSEAAKMMQVVALGVAVVPLFVVPSLLKGALGAAGSVGAKLSGISSKLNSRTTKGASKNLSEKYANSRLAQLNKYRGQKQALNRAKIQSGTYEGRGGKLNPNNLRSGVNKKFNAGRLSGQFGDDSAAAGIALINEEEKKKVDNTILRMKQAHGPEGLIGKPRKTKGQIEAARKEFGEGSKEHTEAMAYEPGGAERDLVKALSTGDTIGARAAASILASSGAVGVEKLHNILSSTPRSERTKDTYNAVKAEVNSANVKAYDSALATWSYTEGGTLSSTTATDGTVVKGIEDKDVTYSGLTALEAAGQSLASLERAQQLGAISPATAKEVLTNSAAAQKLTDDTRKIFQEIATSSGSGGSTAPATAKQAAEARQEQAATGTTGTSPFVVDSAGVVDQNSAKARAEATVAQAAQGTSGDIPFVVDHSGTVTTEQPPAATSEGGSHVDEFGNIVPNTKPGVSDSDYKEGMSQ